MKNEFSDRVVLITGASRGFGKATAERFLAQGAKLPSMSELKSVRITLPASWANEHFPWAETFATRRSSKRSSAVVGNGLGRIDVLVNNAAIVSGSRFEEITDAEWRRTIDTNLTAAFLLMQEVVPLMKESIVWQNHQCLVAGGPQRQYARRRALYGFEGGAIGIVARCWKGIGALRDHRKCGMSRSVRHGTDAR